MDILRHRRNARLKAYAHLSQRRPELFTNPPGAPIQILLDPGEQDTAADRATESATADGFEDECGDIGVVYRDPYLTVIRDAVRFPSGASGTYIRILATQEAPSVAVLPVLGDGRVVLVSHFRHVDRAWHWEIPRGFGALGSDGAQTARRELLEELGCQADRLLRLGTIHPNSGLSTDLDKIYLAHLTADYAVPEVPAAQAADEGIWDIKAFDPDVFRAMILGGNITDSHTVASYALAVARHALPERAGAMDHLSGGLTATTEATGTAVASGKTTHPEGERDVRVRNVEGQDRRTPPRSRQLAPGTRRPGRWRPSRAAGDCPQRLGRPARTVACTASPRHGVSMPSPVSWGSVRLGQQPEPPARRGTHDSSWQRAARQLAPALTSGPSGLRTAINDRPSFGDTP